MYCIGGFNDSRPLKLIMLLYYISEATNKHWRNDFTFLFNEQGIRGGHNVYPLNPSLRLK